jgi:uncharacterized protein DUF3618
MAQDTSKMTRTPRATHSMGFSTTDPEHLRQQIAETRAGMTNTLDAIQDRVKPRNIVNRTMESMKESTMSRIRHFADSARMRRLADSVGSAAGYVMARTAQPRAKLARTTRQNPVPVAIGVGAAAAWMLVRKMRNGRRRDYLHEEAL